MLLPSIRPLNGKSEDGVVVANCFVDVKLFEDTIPLLYGVEVACRDEPLTPLENRFVDRLISVF